MHGTTGRFNYLAPRVRHSLYRNGKVLTHRNSDGSDRALEGVQLEEKIMKVRNARKAESSDRPSLDRNGFQYDWAPLNAPKIDFMSHESVVREYYRNCELLVREHTGAEKILAFDHNVRSAGGHSSGCQIRGGQQVQNPLHLTHGDYTLTSAPQRLRDLAVGAGENDTLRPFLDGGESALEQQWLNRALAPGGRFSFINVWRSISRDPVATHPLALCDARTLCPSDLVVFEIHYSDRVGENYFAKHANRHEWHFYPALTRDEVILIKQWDSSGFFAQTAGAQSDAEKTTAPCTFSLHSAFEAPTTEPDAPDRWSIEVRCAIIY